MTATVSVDKPRKPAGRSHREVSAEHERRKSEASRIVEIRVLTASLRRRKLLERDIVRWLRFYFAAVFTRPLTAQQIAIARAILNAARFGGDQAIAAPRGEGKTTLAECLTIFCVLTNTLEFPVILAATGPDAERILANIKTHLETQDRLHDDYNEVCGPIRALAGLPNRANGQLVQGAIGTSTIEQTRSRIKWAGRHIALPTIPGSHSRAQGALIATRGLDSAIRGLRYGAKRPDLAIVDDPETRELAESLDENRREKLERMLDQDVAGLAGQNRRLARVMLTTCMTRRCVSAKFTDPVQKPSWHGVRYRLIEAWPTNRDRWDEYVQLRKAGQQNGDPLGRKAFELYLANRETMDAGVVVANSFRFVSQPMADGKPQNVSTLQFAFDWIADHSEEAFMTEFQNEPQEEAAPAESGLTAHRIQKQVSGYGRKVIPPGCTLLTQGIDVRKVALHWTVRAWRPDATGYTVAYGVTELLGTAPGSDDGLDMAIRRAILARWEESKDGSFQDLQGHSMPVSLTLVDAGWRTDAVYQACREIGLGIFPSMGFGKSAGCAKPNFYAPVSSTPNRMAGDGWFGQRQPGGAWLVCFDADRWKSWEHDRWQTPQHKPGTMLLWGEGLDDPDRLSHDEKQHHSYARHIVSEMEVEELVRGALVRRWKVKSDNNHWLDASVMADVAAAMRGISVLRPTAPVASQQTFVPDAVPPAIERPAHQW